MSRCTTCIYYANKSCDDCKEYEMYMLDPSKEYLEDCDNCINRDTSGAEKPCNTCQQHFGTIANFVRAPNYWEIN